MFFLLVGLRNRSGSFQPSSLSSYLWIWMTLIGSNSEHVMHAIENSCLGIIHSNTEDSTLIYGKSWLSAWYLPHRVGSIEIWVYLYEAKCKFVWYISLLRDYYIKHVLHSGINGVRLLQHPWLLQHTAFSIVSRGVEELKVHDIWPQSRCFILTLSRQMASHGLSR